MCRFGRAAVIRVGNAELAENEALRIFHALGLAAGAVIETGEMQDAMHHEMRGVMKNGFFEVSAPR